MIDSPTFLYIALPSVFIARSGTGFARCLACSAMCMRASLGGACCGTSPANMCAERAEVAVVLRPASKRIHGRDANICAIEIDQCAISPATFPDIGRCAGLSSMDGFFTCLNTGFQVAIVRCRSLHMSS